MLSVEKTGKTAEEAIAAALAELGATRDAVDVTVLEESSQGFFGLFGNRQAKVRVSVLEKPATAVVPEVKEAAAAVPDAGDGLQAAKQFLEQVLASMKLDVTMEQTEEDGHIMFRMQGEGLGVLIGKHGQTLDALQYLVNLVANKETKERLRIVLDVEDYRKRREETLTALARRIASQVKRSGEKVVLEPMNPHERKAIHMALQNDRRIATCSEGEEPYRKVVIALRR